MKTLHPHVSAIVGASLLLALDTGIARGDDIPKLAGNWTWTWKDRDGEEHRNVLEIEGEGAKLAARERFDDLEPVRVNDLKVDAKKVTFAVVRGAKTSSYSGVVADSETINGTVTVTVDGDSTEFVWKAKRKPSKDKPDSSSAL
jgi:hypothetical protein